PAGESSRQARATGLDSQAKEPSRKAALGDSDMGCTLPLFPGDVRDSGAPIGHGGEFEQPPVNAFWAGFSSLNRLDRSPLLGARLHQRASAGTDTHLPAT